MPSYYTLLTRGSWKPPLFLIQQARNNKTPGSFPCNTCSNMVFPWLKGELCKNFTILECVLSFSSWRTMWISLLSKECLITHSLKMLPRLHLGLFWSHDSQSLVLKLKSLRTIILQCMHNFLARLFGCIRLYYKAW